MDSIGQLISGVDAAKAVDGKLNNYRAVEKKESPRRKLKRKKIEKETDENGRDWQKVKKDAEWKKDDNNSNKVFL